MTISLRNPLSRILALALCLTVLVVLSGSAAGASAGTLTDADMASLMGGDVDPDMANCVISVGVAVASTVGIATGLFGAIMWSIAVHQAVFACV